MVPLKPKEIKNVEHFRSAVMNPPFAIHARTYFCVCILSIASVALRAQDKTKATTTQAQITNVRVGAVPIIIPSPGKDLVEPGPDYRVIFEIFAPVNNRLVAAFVPQNQMDAIHKGNAPPMDEYAFVEVARRREFAETDSATFQQIAEALAKLSGGDLSQFASKTQEEINHNLKALGQSENVTLDKPVPLGILFAMTNAIGVGSITSSNKDGVTMRVVSCLALLRVRGRVLTLITYATYKDEGTAMWVKTTAEQWAGAILKANAD
jgi:hypothetical protein